MKHFLATAFLFVMLFGLGLYDISAQNFKCGDKIVLTHFVTNAHLHSHPINYSHPGSSGQQQITSYLGSDGNDVWTIQDCSSNTLRNGSQIRLQHLSTGMYLHSHSNIPAPVTQSQQEVSGWVGKDNNDFWRIEFDGNGSWTAGNKIRLIHVATNVALHSHTITGNTIPPQQQEVTGYSGRDDNDLWVADIANMNSYPTNPSNGNFPPGGNNSRERVFRGNFQNSDVSARINLSNSGRIDYTFSIRNRDQYVGSCAVFYIILTDNRGNILRTYGGDQYCVEAGVNNRDRTSHEERLSGTLDRINSSGLGNVKVIVTQGGKISPDVLRGNIQILNNITNSCRDCIKDLSETGGGGYQR